MDFAHLDKMGRELKCPICLSLLKSAATLVCNHVFCNACIVESMRSVSSCPVCKVPFRRREVRPAPHMDNLVSIYKSMEAASGLNIFTSQVVPPKNSEEPLQVADNKENNLRESIMMPQSSSRGKRLSKGKRKKMEKVDSRTSSSPCPPTRPSFSSNKRIHVTPYPVSETPIPQKKANKLAVSTNEDTDIIELENNNDLPYKSLEDPTFQPFFWLREVNEDDEGLERMTTPEMTSLTTPNNVPCFSDLKDFDDSCTPKKMTPTSKSAAQEAFDSEMFEWTQRACSPELISTPLKKQNAGGKRFNGFQEGKCGEIIPGNNNYSRGTESSKTCHLDEDDKTTVIACKKKGTLKKRRKQNKEKKGEASTHETASISLNEDHPFGTNEMVEDSSQEKKPSKQIGPLRSSRKAHKNNKSNKRHLRDYMKSPLREFYELADVDKQLSVKSAKEIQNEDIEDTSITLARHGKPMKVVVDLKTKCRKRHQKVSFKSPKQSKKLSLNCTELKTSAANTLSNTSRDNLPNLELEKANSQLQLLSCKKNQGEDSSRRQSRVDQNIQMGVVRKDEQRKLNIQNVDDLAAMVSHKKQHSSTHNVMQEVNQTCTNLQKCFVSSRSKELPHPTMNEVLRKCKNIYSPIICAFCHSSNDSKNLQVSGEIMHYCDGKSVDADYNGGVNVIHSHKNCTEWAPDVYFRDDLVINLSTELARSRRITCSCCGIRGAALGCFEKSCRRSFHYPCAKQTPECRWDNENFVMLCPLHSSSKLPSEMSELQKLNRKISASKGKAQPPSQLKASKDKNSVWTWPAGLACKWVLCSSALSGAEKEILSEFARLTGISISKAWSSVVTHVIASTDENGACKRTLKFLMGILDGKWILSIEWIKACMKSMKPVDEEKYEITLDVHGIHNGPRHGRMRIINKEPKLFSGFWFYLFGDFVPSYKGYLQDLITAGGGKVLQRRPISKEFKKQLDDSSDKTFIVYSLEFPENRQNQDTKVLDYRKAEAIALAEDCAAKVVTNFWILDSIAAATLQVLPS